MEQVCGVFKSENAAAENKPGCCAGRGEGREMEAPGQPAPPVPRAAG